MAEITTLIDKQDNFEIIRDQIASILKIETANQMILAVQEGKNPDLWDLKVYIERANPFELYLNNSDELLPPIVNVWYDNGSVQLDSSNTVKRQKYNSVFNIDCYGRGVSSESNRAGDKNAALTSQRATRLVRNILMSSFYTYLGLQGIVWTRMIQSITSFQVQFDAQSVQKIHAVRVQMNVGHNEVSPQYQPENLEIVNAKIFRSDEDEVLLEAEYNYTGGL